MTTKPTTTTTTTLAVSPGQGLVLSADMSAPQIEKVLENLAGEAFDQSLLPRITVPAGGGLAWTVPGPDGEPVPAPRLRFIVLEQFLSHRIYFGQRFSASDGSPPSCISLDGVRGQGDPGGDCFSCPKNRWGSAVSDDGEIRRGKACRELITILALEAESRSPMILRLPPTARVAWRQYRVAVGMALLSMHEVVTVATLKQASSSEGIKYSLPVFNSERASGVSAETVYLYKRLFGTAPIVDITAVEPF